MDRDKVLIMIRDKHNRFSDKTSEIDWFRADQRSIKVKFKENPNFYYKSYRDMTIYDTPKIVKDYNALYFNGHILADIHQVIQFGEYYKVFLNDGETLVYHRMDCHLVTDKNTKHHQWILRFNYFKTLALLNKDSSDFLASQYSKLHVNKDSVLFKYLIGSDAKRNETNNSFIFPFGINLSQQVAVKQAFNYDVSFIEGPPGTGKTQTILNIIANTVYRKQSIAVVSNNNTAIENVKDKLQEYNLDFLTALLGNRNNKEVFFDETINKGKPLTYLHNHDAKLSNHELKLKVEEYGRKLPILGQLENDLATLKNTVLTVKTEYDKYNQAYHNDYPKRYNRLLRKIKTVKQVLYVKTALNNISSMGFFERLKFRFKYKIVLKSFSDDFLESYYIALTHHYYSLKIKALNDEIETTTKTLKKENFNDIKKAYESHSLDLLKRYLTERYKDMPSTNFTYKNYRYHFDKFIQEYPVILSTSYALIPSAERGFIFDYLVIDEASQTDLLSSLLAFSCAKNVIVVGDTKQLSHIENQTLKPSNDLLMHQYNINENYNYVKHNILTSAMAVFPKAPKTLLKEHYRCHPKIINFCNQKYYNNALIIHTSDDSSEKPLHIIKTVPGNHARKNPYGSGQYNQREIDEILTALPEMTHDAIGVITPFRIQADKLNHLITDDRVEVDTVHKFQGRAKDAIIISTVANNISIDLNDSGKSDFISRDDLLNVAVSRAKKSLHLIISDGIYKSTNNALSDLIHYMEYHSDHGSMKEGQVKSIYDLLYAEQRQALMTFRKKHYKTAYDSENITLKVIEEILEDSTLSTLNVTMHSPLVDLVRTTNTLDDKERSYVNHPWTHVDFLIYNTLTKQPVLVVEVDGVSYHEQNIKQLHKDAIKNKVLKENNISLLRLKTNESSEHERLLNAINTAL